MDKLILFSGSDIQFYNLRIHQPTLKMIKDINGETEYIKRLIPYKNIEIPENNNNISEFDILMADRFIDENGNHIPHIFVNSLKFFFQTENVIVDEQGWYIIINNEFILTKEHFDKLKSIIQEVCCIKNVSEIEDKIPVFKSKKQKEAWEKLQKYRKEASMRKGEDDIITYFDIANLILSNQMSINRNVYDEVMNMTIWQLLNSYSIYQGKELYSYNKLINTSGMVQINKEDLEKMIKDWTTISKTK